MKILVNVKLKSNKNGVEKLGDGSYIVYTKKEARDNMANNDIVKQVAKHFGVGKNDVSIVLGQKMKKKIIEIDLTIK